MILIFPREIRFREALLYAQVHTANTWWGEDLNPGLWPQSLPFPPWSSEQATASVSPSASGQRAALRDAPCLCFSFFLSSLLMGGLQTQHCDDRDFE